MCRCWDIYGVHIQASFHIVRCDLIFWNMLASICPACLFSLVSLFSSDKEVTLKCPVFVLGTKEFLISRSINKSEELWLWVGKDAQCVCTPAWKELWEYGPSFLLASALLFSQTRNPHKLLWVLLTDSQHSEIKLVASYRWWGMP